MLCSNTNNTSCGKWRGTLHLLLGLCCLAFCSCVNDMEKVNFFSRKDLPTQQVKEADIVRSARGDLQISMQAPIIEIYNKPENKTVYPQGVQIYFYNENHTKKAFLRADYAISYDDKDMMEAKKNVVIIDYGTGDTSYLDDLYWNSSEKRIYSNNPVKSINGPRVTYGDGFESDESFETPRILHQRGTVVINE